METKILTDYLKSFQNRLLISLPITHDPEINMSQYHYQIELMKYVKYVIDIQLNTIKENKLENHINTPEMFRSYSELFKQLEESFCLEPINWKSTRLIVRSIAYEYGYSGLRSWDSEMSNVIKKIFVIYRKHKSLKHTSLLKEFNKLNSYKLNNNSNDVQDTWIIYMPDDFRLDPIRQAIFIHETCHIWADNLMGKIVSINSDRELIFDYLAARACGAPYAIALMEYLANHPYHKKENEYPTIHDRYAIIICALERANTKIQNSEIKKMTTESIRILRNNYKNHYSQKINITQKIRETSKATEKILIEEKTPQKASQKVEDFIMKPTPWNVAGKQVVENELKRKLNTLPGHVSLIPLNFDRIISLLKEQIPVAAHPVVLMNAYYLLSTQKGRDWVNNQNNIFAESLEKWWLSYEFLERQGKHHRALLNRAGYDVKTIKQDVLNLKTL